MQWFDSDSAIAPEIEALNATEGGNILILFSHRLIQNIDLNAARQIGQIVFGKSLPVQKMEA